VLALDNLIKNSLRWRLWMMWPSDLTHHGRAARWSTKLELQRKALCVPWPRWVGSRGWGREREPRRVTGAGWPGQGDRSRALGWFLLRGPGDRAVLAGGGHGRWRGGRRAAAVIPGSAASQQGALGGRCPLELPLGTLHGDVVRIRWLKAWWALPLDCASGGGAVSHPKNRN